MRKSTKFFLLRASIIFAFTVLAGRLWYVQVVMGSYYRQQGDTSKIRLEPVAALRGIIYDRKGVQLVYNAPSWNIEIVPHGVPDHPWPMYRELARILRDKTAQQIAGIVYANRWRSYAPVTVDAQVPTQTAMIVMQLHRQLPGVRVDPALVRFYRQGDDFALAHVLGYAGEITRDAYDLYRRNYPKERYGLNDQVGTTGVEYKLEPYLHGINDVERVMVDAGERPVRTLSKGHTVPGDSVYLTIDWNLQQQVANDLQAALKQLNVRQGAAVVENVHTGEILADVSLPSYDSNWFAGGISFKHYQALTRDPAYPLNDLVTQGQLPPGSTFKVVTAAAALETHVVNAATTIEDTGLIKLCSVYDPSSCQIYWGWMPTGLGAVNVVLALAKSSDIYFYTVAGGNPNTNFSPYVGADRLAHYARLLGLGAKTGIELPGEEPGFIPSRTWFDHLKYGPLRNPGDVWHIGDTYNMAIGQGFDEATPLQMVNIAATIANGGTLYQPRIVRSIVGSVIPRKGALSRPQVIQPFVPQIIRRNFLSPGTIQLIQQGMRESVSLPGIEGTSFNVKDRRIQAAGKTGTAEAPGGPDAWWIGYAPFNNPQVAVAVVVPHADSEGAYGAAPVARKIFQDYFHLKPWKANWLSDVYRFLVPGSSVGHAG